MKFRVVSKFDYLVRAPATLLLNARVHSSSAQKIVRERWTTAPKGSQELIVSEPDGNRFDRLRVAEDGELKLHYRAEVEVRQQFLNPELLRKVSPAHLDPRHIPYLLPSRYCQSDLLGRFARQKFAKHRDTYDQVLEIMEWIHGNVEYVPGTSTSATSAYDTVIQCAGVCRDFAHLGIAICRALTVPARYFTGYAYRLDPPDFHACVEAFIGGHWILFDATRLTPLNGLVRIGLGRDAADVSVCTAFGVVQTAGQNVRCELVESGSFRPLTPHDLSETAVSLDAGGG